MNEIEYTNSIDLYFRYDNEKAWKAAIDQGIRISDNAAYLALQRICSGTTHVPPGDVRRMLDCWTSRCKHPTKPTVLKAAKAILNEECLPEAEVLRSMDEVAAYPGLYNALGLIWQAAPREDDWSGNATQAVEKKYDDIRKSWEGTKEPEPTDEDDDTSPEENVQSDAPAV
jgi:hypothetical protein